MVHIQPVWHANQQVYGADKIWRQMRLQGARLAKKVRTTIGDAKAPHTLDWVKWVHKTKRTNQLWVSDFTHASTRRGWLYVEYVTNVYGRLIVGWHVSRNMKSNNEASLTQEKMPVSLTDWH
jgi:putative transposase